jgi:hypothetical protein
VRYALRAVDEGDNPGALATLGALDLRTVRIMPKRMRATIDGLFPVARVTVGVGLASFAQDVSLTAKRGALVGS